IPAAGRIVGDGPRRYSIRAGSRTYRAFRTVVDVGGPNGFGQFLGVQGTTWTDPPILRGPHDTITVAGRRLQVFWDGKAVRVVAHDRSRTPVQRGRIAAGRPGGLPSQAQMGPRGVNSASGRSVRSLPARMKISQIMSGSCWLPLMNPTTLRPVAASTTSSKR